MILREGFLRKERSLWDAGRLKGGRVVRNSKIFLSASAISLIIVAAFIGKLFYALPGGDVIEMLGRYGFQENSVEIKSVGSIKDPAFEWRFEKKQIGRMFSESKDFSIAEDDDKRFFEGRMSRRFGVKGFDDSYKLFRGDVSFGDGMCGRNSCNVYILESENNAITYGAIYGQ